MRPLGATGVQTHFQAFMAWMSANSLRSVLVTPFCEPMWIIGPFFAFRRVVAAFSGPWSVFWYRHWHAFFLRVALSKRLRSIDDCVIYAQCPLSADAALRSRVGRHQKVVLVVHFNVSQADEWAGKGDLREGGALYRSIKAFETKLLPAVDSIVYVSEFMRSELISRIPELGAVPYAIIPNFIADENPATKDARARDLVCVGTLEARKNQAYALEIVAAARAVGAQLTLDIIGDGPDRDNLVQLARKYGVSDQVRFLGAIKAKDAMHRYKGCLHVAKIENLPLTVIEAMAGGLAVFCGRVGGIPEMIDNGSEGRFVPLDNALEAATLIGQWMASEEIIANAGKLARARYERQFEGSAVARRLHAYITGSNNGAVQS